MLYQCTKNMLETLKVEKPVKLDIYNDLFAWNVRMVNVDKKNLVHLMNNATKLSVILYGMADQEYENFDALVKAGIEEVLKDCGVEKRVAQRYLEQAAVAMFSHSGTPKQMAILNWAAMDAVYLFKDHAEEALLQRQLCQKINGGIVKNDNGDYIKPGKVMKNMLARTFGGRAVTYDLGKIAEHMFNEEWFRPEAFLNIRDGSIWTAERDSKGYKQMMADEDFLSIQQGYFDFFGYFNQFALKVGNSRFQQELERLPNSNGMSQRIKIMINRHPDVQQQWYGYEEAAKQALVKEWLETMGLM